MMFAPSDLRQVLGFLLSLFALLPFARGEDMGLVAVPPAELLGCLPPVEPDWHLTESKASHLRRAPPQSLAVREYVKGKAPGGVTEQAPPTIVRISIQDTCGKPELLELYGSGEAAAGGDWTRVEIGNMPARRIPMDDGSEAVDVLALKRFIVSIRISGREKAEDWLRKVDLAALARASQASGKMNMGKSYPFTFVWVDELNPKKSRKVRAEIAGSEPGKEN